MSSLHSKSIPENREPKAKIQLDVVWPAKALIIFGAASVGLAVVAPRPVLGPIEAEIGGGSSGHLLVKLIIGIIGLAMTLGSPLAGALMRRLGQRFTMTSGLLVFVLAGSAPLFLSDLVWIVVSRFSLGVACAVIWICAITLVGDLFTGKQRAQMMGLMNASASAIGVLLAPIAGWIGGYGWRMTFLLYLVPVPLIILALCGLPRSTDVVNQIEVNAEIVEEPGSRTFPLFLMGFALVSGVILSMVPLYLAYRLRQIGISSPFMIGASFIAFDIPSIAVSSAYGLIRARLSTKAVLTFGFALACVSLSFIGMVNRYPLALVGMAAYGPAAALITTGVLEIASEDERQRARVVALVMGALFSALPIGTLLLQGVDHSFGPGGVLIVLAGVSAVMMLVSRRIRKTAP